MSIEILPNDLPDAIVNKFQQAQDEVVVHFKPQPYDIGPRIIKIANKKQPLVITGLDPDGKKVNKNQPGIMPAIRGTAAGLLDFAPNDCGVFYIGPGCPVEMNGLRLIHEIPPYGGGVLAHGSATIVDLADNTQLSSLTLTNCFFETNASTAISVRSDTARGAVPLNKAVNHIKISDCQVTGRINTGILGGNFAGIDLGYWGTVPLDMRSGVFEMNGCTLEQSVLGILAWKVLADSNSKFNVTRNYIGPTAFGVSLIFRPNVAGETVVLPCGDINILDNTIRLEKYLDLPENPGEPKAGAVGILVRVSSAADGQKVNTTIKGNEIDMTKLPPPHFPYKTIQGILYELVPPVAKPELLNHVKYHESHNTVALRPAA